MAYRVVDADDKHTIFASKVDTIDAARTSLAAARQARPDRFWKIEPEPHRGR